MKRPIIRTDLQDDLNPLEQAALAKLRMLKGENPVQHWEETEPVIRKLPFTKKRGKR